MKHVGRACILVATLLMFTIFSGNVIQIQAAATELSETEYQQRMEDTISVAEFFRADEGFIYDANSNLTKEQKAVVKELAEDIISNAGATSEEEKINALVSYVRERMVYDSTGTVDNTYAMLCETEEGSTYSGNSENYCQAVRDLCAMLGIPSFTLLDTREYSSYAIVLVYVGDGWKFIDVAAETTSLVSATEAYSVMAARVQPNSFSFGYTSGNSLLGYAANIYVNKAAFDEERNSGNRNAEFNLYFDTTVHNVVMSDAYAVLKNASFYGAKQKSDENGVVPHGMVEYVSSVENVETATTWQIYQGYSQYGVLLQGYVVIGEEEHQFEQAGYYRLIYRELKEERAPTEEEQEAFTSLMSGRMKTFAKVAEALLQEEEYRYFMDNTEEELAVLTAAMEEATSREYITSIQDLGEEEEIKDAHKAYAIINYIQEHVSYIDGVVVQNSYETLTSGKGTCSNYANLMIDLCYLAGIPGFYAAGQLCDVVVPYGTLTDHAYVIVKLDGKWYAIDPTNSRQIFDMETKRNLYLTSFIYNQLSSNGCIYGSYELMLNDSTNPIYGLCYGFDEEEQLQIYYMNRTGPVANYESTLFSTDENGKVLQRDGFITWEEKVKTEKGYEIHLYEGYARQCIWVYGTQVIDGKTYPFPREKENPIGAKVGYFKKVASEHFDMVHATVSGVEETYTYTGERICPKPVVTYEGEVLTEGEDYTLTYTDNKVVTKEGHGTPTVRVEGLGKYYDYRNAFFSIETKVITEEDVTVAATDLTWNKEMDEFDGFKAPQVTVNAPETDYTISYAGFNGTKQGTITVKGRYNCSGTVQRVVTFHPISLSNGEFEVSDLSENLYTYRGAEYEPAVEVVWKNEDGSEYRKLTGMEYRVSYENNLKAGTATVRISGEGHFTGELETTFTISKVDITKRTAITDAFYGTYTAAYTGEAVMPQIPGITFVNDYTPSIGCKKDIDFVVTAENNIHVGEATITMQGIDNYTGTLTQTFRITPKEYATESVLLEPSRVDYNGKIQTPTVTIEGLTEGVDYQVTCQKKVSSYPDVYEEVTPQEVGTYSLLVEMRNPNYSFSSEARSIRLLYVIEGDSTAPVIPTLAPTSTPIPSAAPTLAPTPSSAPEATPSTTPSIVPSELPAPTATVTKEPDFSPNNGTPSEQPVITSTPKESVVETLPKVAKVKKVKVKAKKKELMLTWKKTKSIHGYQIQISTNKKFKKAKTYVVGKNKTKRKISRLKKKKTYYVRICAFKNYKDTEGNKKRVYGKWVVIKKKTK